MTICSKHQEPDPNCRLCREPMGEPPVRCSAVLGCPWCGKKPAVIKGKQFAKDTAYRKAGEWMWKPEIKCRRCMIVMHGDDIAEMISRWNIRKQPNADVRQDAPK